MSKILVTGAAGFIGSQLSYSLWQKGDEVTLLDDFSYGHEDNLIFDEHDFRNEIVRMDFRDEAGMDKLFAERGFDYVYHLGGITPLPDCQNRPVDAVDVNVKGTTVVLDNVRRHGVKKMFFASTSAVYENNTDFPSVEEKVEFPGLIYPSTKYAAEQICRAFSKAYGIPVVVFRFANVYGPHIDCLRTTPPVMGYIIREFHDKKSPVLHSTGEQKRDFVYVDDLIRLLILVQKAEHFDIVNVSSGEAYSIGSIADTIAKIMGCEDIPIEHAEVGHFWAKYPELYAKPYPISEEMLGHEVLKYTCLSNRHAKEEYGWSPEISLEEGIRRTVDFSVKAIERANNG